jgi:hypothetical protein
MMNDLSLAGPQKKDEGFLVPDIHAYGNSVVFESFSGK